MLGRISDGDLVTLEPYQGTIPGIGDMVLARVSGRRFEHLVLHQILAQEADRFLVGNNHGRADGWVMADDIYGRVTKVESL